MNKASSVLGLMVVLLLSALPCAAQPAPPAGLKPGDQAPDFKLPASDAHEYKLSQFLGTKAVALCWFPFAGSQGARNQCASLETVIARAGLARVQVFGCSPAPLDVTTALGQQGKFSFPLLADTDGAVAQAYGCLRPDGRSERWTFLIDDKGVLLAVNKNTSPQTQGADLLNVLVAAGLLSEQAAAIPPLTPGAQFTVKFPDMPPTLYDMLNNKHDGAQMTVFLPRNYDPQRQHPLLVYLGGGDGGNATNPSIARALAQEQDFVCVTWPLFKAALDPGPNPDIIIRDPDGRLAWLQYKRMLAKLDELIPNLDPQRRMIGGFSNGAHMTGELIDQSNGEAARAFSAFFMIEGGGRTARYDLIKGKPLLMVLGRPFTLPRFVDICNQATAVGVKLYKHEMVGVGHGFPPVQYQAVGDWLRGPAQETAPPQAVVGANP